MGRMRALLSFLSQLQLSSCHIRTGATAVPPAASPAGTSSDHRSQRFQAIPAVAHHARCQTPLQAPIVQPSHTSISIPLGSIDLFGEYRIAPNHHRKRKRVEPIFSDRLEKPNNKPAAFGDIQFKIRKMVSGLRFRSNRCQKRCIRLYIWILTHLRATRSGRHRFAPRARRDGGPGQWQASRRQTQRSKAKKIKQLCYRARQEGP
jgi:hypothetical protein